MRFRVDEEAALVEAMMEEALAEELDQNHGLQLAADSFVEDEDAFGWGGGLSAIP